MSLRSDKISSAACETAVEAAITAVPGVIRVEAARETKIVRVTYEDTQASVEAIQAASAHAGYPARMDGEPVSRRQKPRAGESE